MDKIYSRKKINIPYIYKNKFNKKGKKIYYTMIIFIITVITIVQSLKSIDPIFEALCVSKAQSIATEITNVKSSEVLARYNYQDTVKYVKSEDGKSSFLKTDIVLINQIMSDISIEIQKELDKLENEHILIPIGALIGPDYFSGIGPNTKMEIISTGEIKTDIKTEFKAAGINQTVYRIYLNIECSVSIITSYKTINRNITNQVLLVETVVVGGVPDTYLQMENIE